MTRKQQLVLEIIKLGYDVDFIEWLKKRKTADGLQTFINNHKTHETINRVAVRAGSQRS